MKVGDIVQRKYGGWNAAKTKGYAGIIVKLFEKKCWRTDELGPKVNWDLAEPEPHADVMINDHILSIPASDLEVIN